VRGEGGGTLLAAVGAGVLAMRDRVRVELAVLDIFDSPLSFE
jgi:hypothetical protein